MFCHAGWIFTCDIINLSGNQKAQPDGFHPLDIAARGNNFGRALLFYFLGQNSDRGGDGLRFVRGAGV